jgi:hypothetical protein
MQDGQCFRYGVVNVGARDRKELFEKFEEFRRDLGRGLGFVFLPASSARADLPLPACRSEDKPRLHESVSV